MPGYNTICLTARGTRISNYGTPPVFQNVSGSVCGFTIFTVAGVLATTGAAARPMLAITRPGLHGEVVVAGHTPAVADTVGSASPNLIVHFPDSKSLGEAKSLSHALVRSNRKDAPTAILLAVTVGQLAKVPFMPGIVYAEESDGAWQKTFGVTTAKRPLTLIVTPRGGVIWQKDGPIDPHVLTAALTRHLVSRSPIRINMPRLNTRIGQPAPNFLFEYAGAVEMPLRKLTGQDITLSFWKISSKPSIQAVRDLQKPSANGKGNTPRSLKVAASKLSRPPLVLAVNDGGAPEMARRVAAENGITATVVPDPNREIALAYGVAMWPTIVLIGASGAVTGIGYGHVPAAAGSPSKPAGAQP